MIKVRGVVEFIGIERKIRVTSGTRQHEIERRRDISDDEVFTCYEVDGLEERYSDVI